MQNKCSIDKNATVFQTHPVTQITFQGNESRTHEKGYDKHEYKTQLIHVVGTLMEGHGELPTGLPETENT
jgi:hypothetical protein